MLNFLNFNTVFLKFLLKVCLLPWLINKFHKNTKLILKFSINFYQNAVFYQYLRKNLTSSETTLLLVGLRRCGGQIRKSLLNCWRNWRRCGQMVSLGYKAIFIRRVDQSYGLTFRWGVRKRTLGHLYKNTPIINYYF